MNRTYDFRYPYSLDFEENFNWKDYNEFMKTKWHVSILISLIYIITIFTLKAYMKSKPRFELRTPLILWNFTLAAFSIYGAFFRLLPELSYVLKNFGYHYSVCVNPALTLNPVAMYWVYLFTISK